MTSLAGRDAAALVVIDVQSGVMAGAYDAAGVIERISTLVDRGRSERVPVIWVQHHDDELVRDTEPWRYVPELVRLDDEPLVHKAYRDSFEDTDLDSLLAQRRVGHLVVAGAQTDFCVRSTLHGAMVRGYDVTLVSDAHTTEDLSGYGAPTPAEVITHTNLYWSGQSAPGRRGTTVSAAEVDFAGR